MASLATALLFAGAVVGAGTLSVGAPAVPGTVCPSDARAVSYDVTALETVIPLNGWGDNIADGLVYALTSRAPEIRANPNLTQPLVVRANVGDCVSVTLRNEISGRRVGMHTDGLLRADPQMSDGARVGLNRDSTVATGEVTTYTWYADEIGEAPLIDAANLDGAAPSHTSVQRGLYGAVVVHERGSTWHDPTTGADLLAPDASARATSLFADVHDPAGPDYRSVALVMLDENEDVMTADGSAPSFPHETGEPGAYHEIPDSTFGINYRSEPLRNRMRAVLDHRAGRDVTLPNGRRITPSDHFCDGYDPDQGRVVDDPGAKCLGEESHLQSWPFGDAGKLTRTVDGETVVDSDNLIPKAYRGDPVRYHLVHPGGKETHPFHQHTMRWLADRDDPLSPLNDVQSFGPGDSRQLRLEGGAGGLQGTVGDSIFHCHLYPHFAQGFWGHLRIFDRLRDGTQRYPDGTPIEALAPLPDRAGATPAATAQHPGYPLFVKGEVGQRAYRPPNAVVRDDFRGLRRLGDTVRDPDPLEAANMPGLDRAKPGAGVIDPCPANAPMRVYRPHAIDVPITYNRAGWRDRQGRIYVEENRRADVLSGRARPEPYTIRSRVGDCVQLLTTNDLHLDDDPSVPIDHVNRLDGVYMRETPTSEISTHVHLVRFDELGSDGTSVGWNYVQAAMPGQTYGYRWFVDQPLRTVFFHDHQYANLHQQKGLFAAMNVEPADATFHDPRTGAQTDGVGTVADIRSPSGPDFREFTLFHQDRAPMWRDGGAGDPVAPPGEPDDFGADQGGYAFNYRNEPFPIRTSPGAAGPKGDPAYVYSSAVHGDPSTPVFRAYAGDPVVIRNVSGSHEEVHTFSLHGHRWLSNPDQPASTLVDTQSLSLAEYFNYEIQGGRPVRISPGAARTLRRAMSDRANGVPSVVRGGAGAPGDYLYGSTPLDDQWLGMWGIFRVPRAAVADLAPLPDAGKPGRGDPWPALHPGDALAPPGTAATTTCPAGAPARAYSVRAIRHDIVYNAEDGDHDPNGLMYVLAGDEAAVRAGRVRPSPLFLRANAGDCLKITLSNALPPGGLPAHDGDVPLPADEPFPAGDRVSMHAGLVQYDVLRSDGATVGFNFDQTIAPGASLTSTWYVDPALERATINLVDLGDRRGHRHHGLWGALLIEPAGSTWTDPATGRPISSGPAAVIRWKDAKTGRQAVREFVVDYEDGLNLRDASGAPVPTRGEAGDPYEGGNRGINYRTERFGPRLAREPETAWVMSSVVHGDPETPVFRAYVGDPVWMRVLQGGDRGRAHTFQLHGHRWPWQPGVTGSMSRSSQDGVMPGRAFTFALTGGAGGRQARPGDYLFRDGNLANQVDAGLWGLLRVHGSPQTDLPPLTP